MKTSTIENHARYMRSNTCARFQIVFRRKARCRKILDYSIRNAATANWTIGDFLLYFPFYIYHQRILIIDLDYHFTREEIVCNTCSDQSLYNETLTYFMSRILTLVRSLSAKISAIVWIEKRFKHGNNNCQTTIIKLNLRSIFFYNIAIYLIN